MTIAGSDPSGGAGIQADLKTFHRFGVYGEAVITLLTVQNTRSVSRVECLDPQLVCDQIDAVAGDIPPNAAKTGALGSAGIICAVAACARRFRFPLVVDPVMISKHGSPLLSADAVRVLRTELLPLAALVTPNGPEAAALAGIRVETVADARCAGEAIRAMGAAAVLVKGGHIEGPATDWLLDEHGWHEFPGARIDTPHTHGTGCTYSAAITAHLALGIELKESVRRSKQFITAAIRTGPGLGSGAGPVNHFAPVD
jgi:hydroxymethylpyrimidine/phosphomethylpyrimidine kinase